MEVDSSWCSPDARPRLAHRVLDLARGHAANHDKVLQRLDVNAVGVLAYEEESPTSVHLEEPPGHAEVAISDPEVPAT